jgi:microsomal dipeptidase-like Zn-dependent dipeptidase
MLHHVLPPPIASLLSLKAGGLRVFQLTYGSGTNQGVDEKLGHGGGEGDVLGLTSLGRLVVAEVRSVEGDGIDTRI